MKSSAAAPAGKEGSETAPEAAGPSEGAGSAAQRSSALPIVLSSNRRADISVFKGSTYVNIREYYEVRVMCAQWMVCVALYTLPLASAGKEKMAFEACVFVENHCYTAEKWGDAARVEGHCPLARAVPDPEECS